MRVLFYIIAFMVTGCHNSKDHSEQKEEAPRELLLTFDDFPCQRETEFEEQYKINKNIINTLNKYNSAAIVFVNACGIYRDNHWCNREKMLNEWVLNGYEAGNHTYSHPALSKTTEFSYKIDILKGEPVLKKVLWEYDKQLKYFRYPFLDYGKDLEQKANIKAFLKSRGYEVVHITLDTLDWKFNKMMYEGDPEARSKFIMYVESVLESHVNQSNSVILFHVNKLTSECLDEIIRITKRLGYKLKLKSEKRDKK